MLAGARVASKRSWARGPAVASTLAISAGGNRADKHVAQLKLEQILPDLATFGAFQRRNDVDIGAFWRNLVDEVEPGHVAKVQAYNQDPGVAGQHRGRGEQALAARLRLTDEVEFRISLYRAANGGTALDIIVNQKDINHFTVGSMTEPTGTAWLLGRIIRSRRRVVNRRRRRRRGLVRRGLKRLQSTAGARRQAGGLLRGVGIRRVLHVLGRLGTKIDFLGVITHRLHDRHIAVFTRHVGDLRENRLRIPGGIRIAHAHDVRRHQNHDFLVSVASTGFFEEGAQEGGSWPGTEPG